MPGFNVTAFQLDAYQSGAFQQEVATESYAFQACVFQWGAFQVEACTTPVIVERRSRTNPNLKLRRIVDVKVRGTGGQLVISGGYGAVKAGQERTATVVQFGVGAIMRLRSGSGGVRAVVHQGVANSGSGASIHVLPSRGTCRTGVGTSGVGSLIQIKGHGGAATTGVRICGSGNQLSIMAGELDDVYAVRNPTDEELAVLAYQLYKLVA